MTTVALFLEFLEYKIIDVLSILNITLKTKIILEIAHALRYIHKHGLIHRNLKIDNVMLNSVFEAKIVDFGMVRINECLSESTSFASESVKNGVNELQFMSPEMINDDDEVNFKTDVYSFGVILFFLFVGKLPRKNMSEVLKGTKIQLPKPSSSISDCCIKLIERCLMTDPEERPTFQEVLDFLRENSYNLAPFVDQRILSQRDKELEKY